MNIRPLYRGLRELRNHTREGELAYLCLSGKSENHIRDLVSFNIARAHPSWLIQREVDWVDLTLTNCLGEEALVEFKVGYASSVAATHGNCPVIRGAKNDVEKRGRRIVTCVGLMHFEGDENTDLDHHRNRGLILRSLRTPKSRFEARQLLRQIWPRRRTRVVSVDCGRWDGVRVLIDFGVVDHRRDAH